MRNCSESDSLKVYLKTCVLSSPFWEANVPIRPSVLHPSPLFFLLAGPGHQVGFG